jgi:hypothetical protein
MRLSSLVVSRRQRTTWLWFPGRNLRSPCQRARLSFPHRHLHIAIKHAPSAFHQPIQSAECVWLLDDLGEIYFHNNLDSASMKIDSQSGEYLITEVTGGASRFLTNT